MGTTLQVSSEHLSQEDKNTLACFAEIHSYTVILVGRTTKEKIDMALELFSIANKYPGSTELVSLAVQMSLRVLGVQTRQHEGPEFLAFEDIDECDFLIAIDATGGSYMSRGNGPMRPTRVFTAVSDDVERVNFLTGIVNEYKKLKAMIANYGPYLATVMRVNAIERENRALVNNQPAVSASYLAAEHAPEDAHSVLNEFGRMHLDSSATEHARLAHISARIDAMKASNPWVKPALDKDFYIERRRRAEEKAVRETKRALKLHTMQEAAATTAAPDSYHVPDNTPHSRLAADAARRAKIINFMRRDDNIDRTGGSIPRYERLNFMQHAGDIDRTGGSIPRKTGPGHTPLQFLPVPHVTGEHKKGKLADADDLVNKYYRFPGGPSFGCE